MIIHTTFTNGLFGFAKLYLRTFKHSNGDDFKIVFTTTDLIDDEISQLKDLYKNLIIHNYKFDYEPFCKELGITEEEAKKLKYKVEHKSAKIDALGTKWKLYISGNKRIKTDFPFVMKKYESEDLIVHFDVDMYFKKPLDNLFNLMEKNDFTVMYRPHLKPIQSRTWICAMGIKTKNKQSKRFIEEWGKEYDTIPLKDKPNDHEQISCYKVYKRFLQEGKIKFGNIPEYYLSIGKNGTESGHIISGNLSAVGKDESIRRFNKDFNRLKAKTR